MEAGGEEDKKENIRNNSRKGEVNKSSHTRAIFSFKTITANTTVALIREAHLTQEVLSWARITVAEILLESII